jgi:hypothetical protein
MKCSAEQLALIEKDSAYHDLGSLPSGGIPYKDKSKLYIRPFKLSELRLLSKAVELNELEHLFRAVDNTITVPVEDLTVGDFFYIMLWLRIYSMPKSPYIVEWKCEQAYFVNKETRVALLYTDDEWPDVETLKKDYEASQCGTENTATIHQSDVEIISLEDDFVLPEHFDFPRMGSYIGRSEALKDPEFSLLAPAIQWMKGTTWAEKVAYAEEHPDLIGEALDINRRVVHGISETVKFNCRRCRIEHTSKLELKALSFFQ